MIQFPKPPLLGLDIRADSASVVSLSRRKGQFFLELADREVLAHRAPADSTSNPDVEALSSAVRAILSRSKIRIKAVAAALPAEKTIIKVITLPDTMGLQEIDEQIQFQGTQYIPLSMDAVNFDFSVLPGVTRPGMQDVLLVACKKESLEDAVALIEESGLKPKIMDTRTFALWFLYNHLRDGDFLGHDHSKDTSVVIIEAGYAKFHLYAFENGRPVYEKSHRFGYQDLVDRIQARYEISASDALRMMRFGGLPPEYAQEVFVPFIQKARDEMSFALDFFHNSMPDIKIDSMCLFGEWASPPSANEMATSGHPVLGLDALRESLQQKVSIPVFAPDPFSGMQLSKQVHARTLDADRSAYAVACGLALRRFYA